MKTILLIDDDEVFRKTVGDALSAKDYRVIVAKDGNEGLKVTKKEKLDLILLDILMPELGGMGFLKTIKGDVDLSKIPVILVSNLTSASPMDQGLSLGAQGYIIKSNESLKTIADTVESIIGKA